MGAGRGRIRPRRPRRLSAPRMPSRGGAQAAWAPEAGHVSLPEPHPSLGPRGHRAEVGTPHLLGLYYSFNISRAAGCPAPSTPRFLYAPNWTEPAELWRLRHPDRPIHTVPLLPREPPCLSCSPAFTAFLLVWNEAYSKQSPVSTPNQIFPERDHWRIVNVCSSDTVLGRPETPCKS